MAQQLTCDICEAEPAVMMQSSLLNGETIAIGQACLPLISLATARQVLEQCEPSVLAALAPELTPLVTAISDWLAEGATTEHGSARKPAEAQLALAGLNARLAAVGADAGDDDDEQPGSQEGKESNSEQEGKARTARRRGTTGPAAGDGVL